MITARQAVKACILCQFIAKSSQPIWSFQYDPDDRILSIVAGYNRDIRVLINEGGRFRYV